jgi:hypothetical protein
MMRALHTTRQTTRLLAADDLLGGRLSLPAVERLSREH